MVNRTYSLTGNADPPSLCMVQAYDRASPYLNNAASTATPYLKSGAKTANDLAQPALRELQPYLQVHPFQSHTSACCWQIPCFCGVPSNAEN